MPRKLFIVLSVGYVIATGLDAAYPPADAVADCPKIEVRELPATPWRPARLDTVTVIPEDCR